MVSLQQSPFDEPPRNSPPVRAEDCCPWPRREEERTGPAGLTRAANLIDSGGAMAQLLLPVTFRPVSLPSSEPAGGAVVGAPRKPARPAGDYGAFFRATLAPLRRYIARLIGSPDEAQDIAQDAYAKVYTVMQERPVEHPQALLYTTARNLAIDELRHRGRAPFEEASIEGVSVTGPGPAAAVMAREEAALLEQAIHALPDECRNVILLRMGEHLTHEQVAGRLGLTKKQAEKRLHRAVRLLHLALHAPAGPPPAARPPWSNPR